MKNYLRAGGGLVYYETTYNTSNDWYPGLPMTERTFEDFINAACKRLTVPFNPFTGEYENIQDLTGEPFGIDAAHTYIGDLGVDGQRKAVINGQAYVSCWANYLLGVERLGYAGSTGYSPDKLNTGWLTKYTDLFDETPFYWLAGLQCIIPFRNAPNVQINHAHLTDADEGQKNWESKTPLERATFVIEQMLESDELADLRVGAFIVTKDMHFNKDRSPCAIFDSVNKDVDWRHDRIPGQITPRRPQNLAESRMIDLMLGTDSQLYGLWKTYMQDMFDYLLTVRNENENVVIFSDASSKDMVKQQYHEPGIMLSHEKIIDMADFLVDKVTNWQLNLDEWDDSSHLVTRPPDFVKLVYDSEPEYYSLAEAWWIMLYALYLIATNEGLTELPDIALKPVIGPCQPNVCPMVNATGLPVDSRSRINIWWQHDEHLGLTITFSEIKKAIRGLYPQAQTSLIGPTYPTNRQVILPKVIWRWPFIDSLSDTVQANAAESLYIMAKALVNWEANKTAPAAVSFLPSHVLPKLFYEFCQHSEAINPFGTDTEGQEDWFDIGQRWTLKPAVLKPEFR